MLLVPIKICWNKHILFYFYFIYIFNVYSYDRAHSRFQYFLGSVLYLFISLHVSNKMVKACLFINKKILPNFSLFCHEESGCLRFEPTTAEFLPILASPLAADMCSVMWVDVLYSAWLNWKFVCLVYICLNYVGWCLCVCLINVSSFCWKLSCWKWIKWYTQYQIAGPCTSPSNSTR
jgi:hypothetical protein